MLYYDKNKYQLCRQISKKCGHQIMTRNCYLISIYSDRYKEIKNKIIEKVEKVKKSYERGVITEEEATEVLCKMLLWDLDSLKKIELDFFQN